MDYAQAKQMITGIIDKNNSSSVLQLVVDFLYETFDVYSWIGIYLVKGDNLILGPWRGKQATEHTTIPIGTGICGAAAQTGKTEIVDDVKNDLRYLSCFLSTRSEIVVPILKQEKVIGEIDIDSDMPAAFTKEDAAFLAYVAEQLSAFISEHLPLKTFPLLKK